MKKLIYDTVKLEEPSTEITLKSLVKKGFYWFYLILWKESLL